MKAISDKKFAQCLDARLHHLPHSLCPPACTLLYRLRLIKIALVWRFFWFSIFVKNYYEKREHILSERKAERAKSINHLISSNSKQQIDDGARTRCRKLGQVIYFTMSIICRTLIADSGQPARSGKFLHSPSSSGGRECI